MLALTRKKGESIMIGDEIELVVLSISGEQVKLGIMAPKSITIHRKEIYEQIIAENREASLNVKLSGLSTILQKHSEPGVDEGAL